MTAKKLAFLGAGKMATAIAAGLVDKKIFSADQLIACDKFEGARDAFTARTGIECLPENVTAMSSADAILLAIKPQDAPKVLPEIAPVLQGKLIISIAAGLSIAKLKKWSGCERVIRVMPNTPSMVGKGAAVFSCSTETSVADGDLARTIFGAVGIALEMNESKLDAVTGLSGSGPAYVFEFVQSLVDGAVAMGLEPDDALQLFVQTVAGAAEMLKQKCGTPDELRKAVTSPGGTTAAGLAVMADADFRGLMANVVKAATNRSIELGQG